MLFLRDLLLTQAGKDNLRARGGIYSLVCLQEAMGKKVVATAPMPVAACLLLISQQKWSLNKIV